MAGMSGDGNPFGEDYEDLVGEVDTSPEQDWKTDPRLNHSQNFQYLGSIGSAKPMDISNLSRDREHYIRHWTSNDVPGDIVLNPEVLEESPADTTGLLEKSVDSEKLYAPIRFWKTDGKSIPYTGFLRTGEIDEDVVIETPTQNGFQNVELGKEYRISFLPENYRT
jgi:hypothetical protein